ncbi:hypothetical protein Ancab_024429 [Ancistrocladus abbreviatus]
MVRRRQMLHAELWSLVFQHLPVKSLLQFRLVCQEWRTLIDDPYFIYQHIEYSRKHRETTHFLVAELPLMKMGGLQWMIRSAATFRKAAELTHFNFTPGYCSIHGYADGLLLILEEIQQRRIFLCNPSIRKCIQIPSNLVINLVHDLQLGLGFDHLCNDYKVVAINCFWPFEGKPSSFVMMYSLKSRSWKHIADNTPTVQCKGPQAFVKGAIHWMGCNKSEPKTRSSQVVSFNVVREAFSYVSLPANGDDLNWRETSLMVFHESLALLDAFRDHLCIWVQEKEGCGEAESWVKQYILNLELFDYPIYLKENGKLLYIRKGQGLKSYDIESHLVKDLAKTYRRRIIFIEPYVESLALMGGVNGHQLMSLPLQEMEEHNNQENQLLSVISVSLFNSFSTNRLRRLSS